MSESPQRRRRVRRIVLGGVLLIHAVVYWLVVFKLQYFGELRRVIAVGVVLGQCSLVVILSTTVREVKSVRIAMPWMAAFASWYGISQIFYWGLGEAGATWWAIAITVQTIVCIAGAKVLEQHWKQAKIAVDVGAKTETSPLQFPIRSLILLTTMAAIGFSVIDFGRRRGWWLTDSLEVKECVMMVAVGLMVGLTALMGVFASASRKRLVVAKRLAVLVVSVPLLGFALHAGAVWAGLDGASESMPVIVFLVAHVTCATVTWVILDRLPGRLA
ncbi:hypothetical protein [Planctomycetes bacterium TBK1r]|uniref:Uncharacterized protein n=1 Tax=Stieleria magnilauensis TaxID=2527963 RepID=A0ABX5Y2G7_9BACT|nr:hypothetical protein TBK1r_72430 [Planctomycetes bacterium TBK1r]